MGTTKTTKANTNADVKATTAKKAIVEAAIAEEKPVVKKYSVKDIDLHQYITVKNGFQGSLVYRSKKTGEIFRWEEFGDEQEIELLELKNAKNSSKGFFANNWFMFDDEWVIDFLGVRQYYKGAVRIEEFDEIFAKTPDEIKTIIAGMSKGQKKSASYRARQLIAEGEIDSNKAIAALEEALGVELVVR